MTGSLVPTGKVKLHLYVKNKEGGGIKARRTCCLNFSIIEIREWFRSEDLWLSFRSVIEANRFFKLRHPGV